MYSEVMRIKGWLDSMVLAVVSAEPAHGYKIAATIRDEVVDLAGASLYPVLKKLEADGCLKADWDSSGSGPARKVYSITSVGMKRLGEDVAEWRSIRSRIDGLFEQGSVTGVGRGPA